MKQQIKVLSAIGHFSRYRPRHHPCCLKTFSIHSLSRNIVHSVPIRLSSTKQARAIQLTNNTCLNFSNCNFNFCVFEYQQRNMSHNRKVSSDVNAFQDQLNRATKIVALTGAGISAESGIPTFRGEGGFWRNYKSEELATPEAFAKDPGLVWQFYEYRRQLVSSKEPNLAHKSLSILEQNFIRDSPHRQVIVVTQNVDELHRRAGAKRVLELHGSLFKTRCTQCKAVKTNFTIPIVPVLENIKLDEPDRHIDPKDLPRCEKCTGLLRPHVVWFGEQLDPFVLKQAEGLMSVTDFLLVVGTSSVVYPAASLIPQAATRGVTVSEFNIEQTAASEYAKYFFKGPCAQTLPKALQIGETMISHWG
ncbi:NAD-dependent protein deacylase-like [Dermatophagoides pteronyssinus]|uniref:NAD-dependent protein deacylase n=1 Tax=Dermatophagoides pteronyssinus TaxID=6956 RepID=A0ABQ8J501_DERPT|nr:NAD-dependent protein deacylase sirtuin-5, mitochondrial [Dermatophagoides pteronyssinus]